VVLVPVPTDMGLVFDGKRWTVAPVPPPWFCELMEAGNDVIVEQPIPFVIEEVIAPDAA
jgi:hypothetical protein